MPTTSAVVVIHAPIDRVWHKIGDFNSVPEWHPAVAESTLEAGGKVRRVSTSDGEESVERLIGTGPNWYAYEMVSGPMPVAEFRAILRVDSAPDETTLVSWAADYKPLDSAAEAAAVIRPFLEAGLGNLRVHFPTD